MVWQLTFDYLFNLVGWVFSIFSNNLIASYKVDGCNISLFSYDFFRLLLNTTFVMSLVFSLSFILNDGLFELYFFYGYPYSDFVITDRKNANYSKHKSSKIDTR